MVEVVRVHRVMAFCDWLETVAPQPPFQTRPEFRFYRDLTGAEFAAAEAEMRRRERAALMEAQALEAERRRRANETSNDGPEAA